MKTYTKCIVRARDAARMCCYTTWDDFNSKTNWGIPNVKHSFLISREGRIIAVFTKKTYTTCIVRARTMQLACCFAQNGTMLNRQPKGGNPNCKNSFLFPREGHIIAAYMKTCAKEKASRALDGACVFFHIQNGMMFNRKSNRTQYKK